jgi:hypothetical protein
MLVLGCLIRICDVFPEVLNNGEFVSAVTLEELVMVMPFSLKALIEYKGLKRESMAQLVSQCEGIGTMALSRMRIENDSVRSEARKASRRRAAEVKKSIMASFKSQQANFSDGTGIEGEAVDAEECSVCHSANPDDIIVFPVAIFKTILPDLVQSELDGIPLLERTASVGFRMCCHHFHRKCISSVPGESYSCPVDRGFRNAYLPKQDDDRELAFSRADHEFLRACFNSIPESSKAPIRALAGEIILLEVRHRSHPEILDKSNSMYKYLFLVIRRSYGHLAFEEWPTLPLEQLLFRLVHATDIAMDQDEFSSLINEMVSAMTGGHYEFMRRAALVQHFILGLLLSNRPEWDVVLEHDDLCERYHFSHDPEELPVYRLKSMPRNFLDFMLPPYEIDQSRRDQKVGICLLTGVILSLGGSQIGEPFHVHPPGISEHLESLGGAFGVVAILSGPCAGNLEVIVSQGESVRLRSIYVDDLGDEDRGFTRGELLHLSVSNFESVMDTVLSGEWADGLRIGVRSFYSVNEI